MQNEIHAVSLKLPEFWTNMPSAWFVNIESQFILRRITDETTKFHYVIQALPQGVIAKVTDHLTNLSDTPYSDIKKALMERFSLSEGKRIEQLLSGEELGDKKPSDFYRHLKNIAGESGIVTDKLILELWMRRLPTLVQVSVKASNKTDPHELIVMADSIYEVYQQQRRETSSVNSISNGKDTERAIFELTVQNQELKSEISEIRKMLSDMNFRNSRSNSRFRDKSRGRFRSGSRNRNSSSNNSDEGMCWYHNKFGAKAENCKQPCSFYDNGKRNSTN